MTRTLGLTPVVRKVDNAIHRINHYPVDSVVCLVNTYPLDREIFPVDLRTTGPRLLVVLNIENK